MDVITETSEQIAKEFKVKNPLVMQCKVIKNKEDNDFKPPLFLMRHWDNTIIVGRIGDPNDQAMNYSKVTGVAYLPEGSGIIIGEAQIESRNWQWTGVCKYSKLDKEQQKVQYTRVVNKGVLEDYALIDLPSGAVYRGELWPGVDKRHGYGMLCHKNSSAFVPKKYDNDCATSLDLQDVSTYLMKYEKSDDAIASMSEQTNALEDLLLEVQWKSGTKITQFTDLTYDTLAAELEFKDRWLGGTRDFLKLCKHSLKNIGLWRSCKGVQE